MKTESKEPQEKKLETLEEAAMTVLNEYKDVGFEGAANRLGECQIRLMYIYHSLFDDVTKKDPAVAEICKDIKDCYDKMSAMISKLNSLDAEEKHFDQFEPPEALEREYGG